MQSLTGTLKTRRVSTNLVRLKHAVEPRQELLRAVVGVQHHRDAVELGHLSHVQGHGYGPGDGRLLLGLLVVDAFAGEESGAAVRHLRQKHVRRVENKTEKKITANVSREGGRGLYMQFGCQLVRSHI